jgi:TonB-linked SusC/RagA family outer membrane protein
MKKLLLMLAVFLWSGLQIAMAQSRPVKGQVLDETGEGVPGASVQVKGTTAGTITDADGNFSLEVPDDDNTLIIKAIGYSDIQVNAGDGDNVLNIRLTTSNTQLSETIVTANAVKREKRSLGYSTTTVGSDELGKGGSTSPINSLAGKIAGVNITTTSNSPGSSSRIVLRGGSSILGNNQALIVVDGVPISNGNFGTSGNVGNLSNQVDFGNRGNDINPDDIESVTVLKGPAATVIYGSAASNGALMITTKKGRRRPDGAKKTEVEVNTGVSFSSILKYPDFQNSYGQGDLHGVYDDRRENFSWGLPFDDQNRPWGQVIDGQQKVKPYSALPNNTKDFFDVGKIYTNSVAVNSGNEDAAFRLGFNTLNSTSIFPGKSYDKYNVTFSGNANLTNKFYASISFNYSKSVGDLVGNGQGASSLLDNLYQMPRDIPIRDLRNMDDKFNSMDYVDANGVHRYGYYGAYALNPYYTLEKFKNANRVDRILGNITLGYKPFTWLKIENRLGTDMYTDRRYQSAPLFSSDPADESGLYTRPQNNVGRYSEDVYNLGNIYNDLMVTLNKDFAKDFNINVLVGHNVTQQRLTDVYSSTNEDGGLIVPDYYNLQNSNGKILSFNSLSLVRRVGLYGDASVSYKNMLFAGVTARNDWSSTVPKSYFYYGGNVSFVFSELFNESLKRYWNYGKFRMSYGSVGNDANPYVYTTVYNQTVANGDFGSNVFPFKGVPGFGYGDQIGNPNITPEISKEYEIGTEQAFFDNRITLDFSYYSKRSENQIIPVSLAPSSGFRSKVINAGLLTNKGVELAVRFTPVMTRTGFRWDLFGTFTKNTSLVKEIYPGTDQINTGNGINGMTVVAAVGKPYGTFYTNGYLRDPNGNIVVDSTTGRPRIDPSGNMYFGSYQPKFQASWGTSLSYKGFSLYVMFDMKKGGEFFSRTKDLLAFVGTSKETEKRDPYVWENSVYEGSDGAYHTNNTKFDPYLFYTTQAGRPNEFMLVDASYVKLREARISYSLPAKWMSKTPFGSATVSIFGNNLFIWTPKENQYSDPELSSNGAANAQGFEFSAAPSLRNYGFNLKFTF